MNNKLYHQNAQTISDAADEKLVVHRALPLSLERRHDSLSFITVKSE